MKPEAQRIAIARAFGLTGVGVISRSVMHVKDGYFEEVPDYLNSLDAMHEAEKTLTRAQYERYEQWLEDFLAAAPVSECPAEDYSSHSPASRRAECFLRTKALWMEEKE